MSTNNQNLIQKLSSFLSDKKEQRNQRKIDKAFNREMHVYEETVLDLQVIGFGSDIKYHISERSQNILYLLKNTSLEFSITRDFLADLDEGLAPYEKKELIKILKSKENIKVDEEDLKILRLDWQNDDLLPAQKIGTKPSRVSFSYERC